MAVLRPPRREPRILAVASSKHGIAWAVADPWELRGSGTTPCRCRSRRLAIVRLLRREKPTAIVTEDRAIRRLVARIARLSRLAIVGEALPELAEQIAGELYPELRLRAPTRILARLALLAIRAALHSEPKPRTYAHRKPDAQAR